MYLGAKRRYISTLPFLSFPPLFPDDLRSCAGGLQVPPPFVPHTKGAGDSSNFDAFDEQPLKTLQHDKYEREFRNF